MASGRGSRVQADEESEGEDTGSNLSKTLGLVLADGAIVDGVGSPAGKARHYCAR